MRVIRRIAIAPFFCLLLVATVWAAAPNLMNFQGRLTNADGAPMAGTYSVTFTLHGDSLSPGPGYFQETKSITANSNGLFSTILGTSTQLWPSTFNDTALYLGIKVGNDPEIIPRTRITSVPFAYRVQTVEGAGGGTIYGNSSVAGHFNISGQSTHQSGATVYGGLSSTQTGGYAAVQGVSNGTQGNPNYGIRGIGDNSTYVNYGVYGEAHDANNTYHSAGVYGRSISDAGGLIWAGFFDGWVYVNGNFSAASKSFRIDDPTDPANGILQHACVESDEYKNVYDGVITLDASGQASVTLPVWFEALNKNFRYQLTAIGAPAPNLHVAQKINDARFHIAGGEPGMEVSWQITGVRKDAYAIAHPVEVQKAKPDGQRGKYLHPKEHGVAEELGVEHDARMAMQRASEAAAEAANPSSLEAPREITE